MALGPVALSVCALVVASCSGGGSSSASRSRTTTTTSAPASTSTVVATSTTTTTATLSTCQVNVVALSLLGSSGAAGTLETTFGLKNSSTSTCTLVGYPGFQLLSASGTPFGTTVRGGSYSFTDFSSARVVVLSPGQSAYFNVGYSDVPTGSETTCPSSARVEVTPPDDVSQLSTPFAATACSNGTVVVSPVFGATSPETQTTAPPQG